MTISLLTDDRSTTDTRQTDDRQTTDRQTEAVDLFFSIRHVVSRKQWLRLQYFLRLRSGIKSCDPLCNRTNDLRVSNSTFVPGMVNLMFF